MTIRRRFECVQGSSSKFWEICLEGAQFSVSFGRIGTEGQAQTKTFGSEAKARVEHDKLVREKVAKGYKEVSTELSVSVPPSLVERTEPEHRPLEEVFSPSVRWNPAARHRLELRRPCAKPPAPTTPAWPTVQAACAAIVPHAAQGVSRAPEDLGKLMERVAASLQDSPRALDVEVEAARASLLGVETRLVRIDGSGGYNWNKVSDVGKDLVELWLERESPAFAVEALARSTNLELVTAGEALWLEPRRGGSHPFDFREIPEIWRHLRRHLAAADEPAYAEARARAETLRRTASGRVRCALAYLFPAEADWANEDAREIAAKRLDAEGRDSWLLASANDLGSVEALVDGSSQVIAGAPLLINLLETIGPSAFPSMRRVFERAPSQPLLDAMALVDSEESFSWLAERLDERNVAAAASESFVRAPALAVVALARAAARKPGASKVHLVLRSIVTAHPEAAHTAADRLQDAERAIVEAARQSGTEAPDATPEELPPVLVRPPWKEKRPPMAKAVFTGLTPLPIEERVVWKPGEQEACERSFAYSGERERSARLDAKWLTAIETQRRNHSYTNLGLLFCMTDGPALRTWNESPPGLWRYAEAHQVLRLLARFGLPALPGLLTFAKDDLATGAEALSHVRSPLVAPLMAQGLRLKRVRPFAERWLAAFPAESASCLVPAAVNKDGPERRAAETALRYLDAKRHGDAVRSAARRYGEKAAAAVEEILAFDPLLLFPARLPKMPAFWTPRSLARPLLSGREKALPPDAVEALGCMLAFSSLDSPYEGLAEVRKVSDPQSLAEFAWDLFSAWQLAGSPSKEGWAYLALGHFGDDEVARRLAPLVREWPHSGQIARAYQGLEILARIGTDVALMHLHGIAQKVKSRALQERAAAKIQEIAETRSLTSEELADRLVPDLGLDRDGSRVLDFGPRSFRVGFDEHLKPYVKDESGKKLAELAKPGKSDDTVKAAEAAALWKSLKKEARGIAATQIARLELAMCSRRRWSLEDFKLFFVEHPLLVHPVRRLVWGAFDESRGLITTFRVAEDGTFADVEDRKMQLPAEARVGVLHRLEISAEQVDGWGQVFAEYEILQPFAQLGRTFHRRPPEEASKKELDPVKGLKVLTVRVLGLEGRGWRRGKVGDGGVIGVMVKPLPSSEYQAELALDPGIVTGLPKEFPEQTLGPVTLQRRGTWDEASRLAVGEIDEITYSELVADVMSLKP